jgi:predicted metalloprotease
MYFIERQTMPKGLKFAVGPMLPMLAMAFAANVAGQGVEITRAEIDGMAEKVSMASSFVDDTWTQIFSSAGKSFAAPRLVAFTRSIQTGCGMLASDNAHYCGTDNTVYYDIEFFAKLRKFTARELRSDGSYAPITVLWHEVAHGVAETLGINPVYARNQENLADCLAGVVMKHAVAAGSLEAEEIEEGLFALKLGGDRPTTPFDSARAHGPAEERQVMFNRGVRDGLPACSESIATKLTETHSTATSFHGH